MLHHLASLASLESWLSASTKDRKRAEYLEARPTTNCARFMEELGCMALAPFRVPVKDPRVFLQDLL